jgi:hypothetical protein
MTELCPHLMESGLERPMTLIVTPEATAYTCVDCAMVWAETLTSSGTGPHTILDALHFDMCGHTDGGTCFACLGEFKEQISKRFAILAPVDKNSANRLLRIKNGLNKRYSRAMLVQQEAEAEKPLPAYPGLRRTGRGLDAAKAGQRWQGLRALRLTALVPPPANVVVVHKSS